MRGDSPFFEYDLFRTGHRRALAGAVAEGQEQLDEARAEHVRTVGTLNPVDTIIPRGQATTIHLRTVPRELSGKPPRLSNVYRLGTHRAARRLRRPKNLKHIDDHCTARQNQARPCMKPGGRCQRLRDYDGTTGHTRRSGERNGCILSACVHYEGQYMACDTVNLAALLRHDTPKHTNLATPCTERAITLIIRPKGSHKSCGFACAYYPASRIFTETKRPEPELSLWSGLTTTHLNGGEHG